MENQSWTESISRFLERQEGAPPRGLELSFRPLTGGLEAAGISRVRARYKDAQGHARQSRFVLKSLEGTAAREAHVYAGLVAPHARELSPRLLDLEQVGPEQWLLFLEEIRRAHAWPWRETEVTQSVLHRLASLHTTLAPSSAATALPPWDYEEELRATAGKTLEALERCRRRADLTPLARRLPALRRMVQALPELRRQLLAFHPFDRAPLHGDVHPGNALLRRRNSHTEPILIDWGRARVGSPLEDVNSWLQSLGYWEPEARRKHDTLLAGYLSARGLERRLVPSVREAYWLAGASNALSGALLYHLLVACDPRRTEAERVGAFYAARDWLRVIRRADAGWS